MIINNGQGAIFPSALGKHPDLNKHTSASILFLPSSRQMGPLSGNNHISLSDIHIHFSNARPHVSAETPSGTGNGHI